MTNAQQKKIQKLHGNWRHWDTSEKGWEQFTADQVDYANLPKVLKILGAKEWIVEVNVMVHPSRPGALSVSVKP